MKKMINEYIDFIEKELSNKKCNYEYLKNDLLVKISFFQHERLIHFLVTMLVGMITIILLVTSLFAENLFIMLLLLIFVILLIPYIFHYYFLENKVQYLYSLYDIVDSKLKR